MITTIPTTDRALRAAHERRLRQLEIRAARQGYDTPAEIHTEIAEIKAALAADAAVEPANETERYVLLAQRLNGLTILVDETRVDVKRLLWLLPILMLTFTLLLIVLVKL
jgi:hypothetical protein